MLNPVQTSLDRGGASLALENLALGLSGLCGLARQLLFPIIKEGKPMIYYALIFLVVGLIAGALGLFGIAAVASQISWILFLIGIVMLIIHLVTGGRSGARVP